MYKLRPNRESSVQIMRSPFLTRLSTVPLAAPAGSSPVFYDLLGRPVSAPAKGGIYIRDGRKIRY